MVRSAALEQPPPSRPKSRPTTIPPARTGLRGTHDGAWEIAHALRDGRTWDEARDTGERYDLVVVGGGISGLAAAYFFRQAAGRDARILVLDNHDDFGGHAKRNEFTAAGACGSATAARRRLRAGAPGVPSQRACATSWASTPRNSSPPPITTFYTKLGTRPGCVLRPGDLGRRSPGERRAGQPGRGTAAADRGGASLPRRHPSTDAARRDFIRVHEENVDYLPGSRPRAEARAVAENQLPRFPSRLREGRLPGDPVLPAAHAQRLGHRHRRDAGDGARSWLAGFQGLGLPPFRNDGDPVHFPLSRRQRLHRAPAGPRHDSVRGTRQHDGGRRHGAVRLREAR